LVDRGLARPGQGSAQHAHFNLHAATTVEAGNVGASARRQLEIPTDDSYFSLPLGA
jgi:hypothetical protein